MRQTLAHVGSAERSHLLVARAIVSKKIIDIPGFDLDAWNAAEVAEREHWSWSEVLADLHGAHEDTMAFLDSLDPAKLTITGTHPALGALSVAQVLRIIALHDGMHRRDLARLRDQMREARAHMVQVGGC